MAPGVAAGAWEDDRRLGDRGGQESTGVGRRDDEPIGDSLGALVKGLAFSASMASDLAMVEDQG